MRKGLRTVAVRKPFCICIQQTQANIKRGCEPISLTAPHVFNFTKRQTLLSNQNRNFRSCKNLMTNATGIFFNAGQPTIANNNQIIVALLSKTQDLACRICSRNKKRVRTLYNIISKLISCSSKQTLTIRNHHIENTLKRLHLISGQERNRNNINQIKIRIFVAFRYRSSNLKSMTRPLGSIICNKNIIKRHANPLPSNNCKACCNSLHASKQYTPAAKPKKA